MLCVQEEFFQRPLLQSFTPEDNRSSSSLCHSNCAKFFAITLARTLLLSEAPVSDFQVLSNFRLSSSTTKTKQNTKTPYNAGADTAL